MTITVPAIFALCTPITGAISCQVRVPCVASRPLSTVPVCYVPGFDAELRTFALHVLREAGISPLDGMPPLS